MMIQSKYKFQLGTGLLLCSLIFGGCASNQYASKESSYMVENSAMSAGDTFNMTAKTYDDSYMTEDEAVRSTIMVAKEAHLTVDVKDLEDFDSNISKLVQDMGGYFTNTDIQNYDGEYSTDRYAYYTLKVPADKLDDFINTIDGAATITERNISSEDISLQYIDNDARLEASKTEREKLLKLMDEATEVSDMIEIESRLSDVQYQIDSAEQQKRTLKGRVDYSLVNITAHEERNVEHPIRKAFEINFREQILDGMENAVKTFVRIIAAIPVIIIVTAFIILFIWVLKKVLRKIFKRDRNYRFAIIPIEQLNKEDNNKETSVDRKF